MLRLMCSISISGGSIIISFISIIIAVSVSRRSKRIKNILALIMPFILANFLYWLPVWLGSNVAEYFVWAPVFIISWFTAGLVSFVLTINIVNKVRDILYKD